MVDGKEFKEIVKGSNFMTPKVLGFWQSGNYQCELSLGYFGANRAYGVTVVNTDKMTREFDLSKSFDKRKDALNYMKILGL